MQAIPCRRNTSPVPAVATVSQPMSARRFPGQIHPPLSPFDLWPPGLCRFLAPLLDRNPYKDVVNHTDVLDADPRLALVAAHILVGDEARDDPSFSSYRRLDLYYVENWSIGLDLAILAATVGAVVLRGGRLLVAGGERR